MHFADSSTQDSAGIPLEHKTECTRSHFNSAAFLIVVCMYWEISTLKVSSSTKSMLHTLQVCLYLSVSMNNLEGVDLSALYAKDNGRSYFRSSSLALLFPNCLIVVRTLSLCVA